LMNVISLDSVQHSGAKKFLTSAQDMRNFVQEFYL
jgi:hypothetical protein